MPVKLSTPGQFYSSQLQEAVKKILAAKDNMLLVPTKEFHM